jgi:hypothetical protein
MNDFLRGLCVVLANLIVASVASADWIVVEKSIKHHRHVVERDLLATAGDLWSLPEPKVFNCDDSPSFVMRFDVSVSTHHRLMDMYHPTSRRSLFVCYFILTAGFHLCFRITLPMKCLRGRCFEMMRTETVPLISLIIPT